MSAPKAAGVPFASKVLVSISLTVILMAGITSAWISHVHRDDDEKVEVTVAQFESRIDRLSARSRLILAHLFAMHSSHEGFSPRSMEVCVDSLFQGESDEWLSCAPLERSKMRASVELFSEILDYVEAFGASHGDSFQGSRVPAHDGEGWESESESGERPLPERDENEEMPKGPHRSPYWDAESEHDAVEA
jgi:hypothetical protein